MIQEEMVKQKKRDKQYNFFEGHMNISKKDAKLTEEQIKQRH